MVDPECCVHFSYRIMFAGDARIVRCYTSGGTAHFFLSHEDIVHYTESTAKRRSNICSPKINIKGEC